MAVYDIGAAPFNAVFHFNAGNGKNKKRAHRSHRRRFHDGQHLAVLRAFLAARAYAAGWFTTLAAAAVFAGSNIPYVRAALLLFKNGDDVLVGHVSRGNISILRAAAQVEPQVKLIETYAKASQANLEVFRRATGATADLTTHLQYSSAEEKAAAARNLGTDAIWETMIVPIIATPAE